MAEKDYNPGERHKSFGEGGWRYLAAATDLTKVRIYGVLFNEDSVIANWEEADKNMLIKRGLSGVTVTAGVQVFAQDKKPITRINLTSGSAIVYYY